MDLVLPSNQGIGSGTVSVLVDGRPGAGSVDFESPSGRRSTRTLDSSGTVDFYFDEGGEWRIRYGDTSKRLTVTAAKIPTPSPTKLAAVSKAGTQTGFATGASFNLWWLLIAALVLFAAWLFYERFWRVLSVKKTVQAGKAVITVRNRFGDLNGVELLDLVPEGATAEAFSEQPEERDTINGKSLKWRKYSLRKGDAWVVSYSIGGAKTQSRVEARGRDAKGREVHATG